MSDERRDLGTQPDYVCCRCDGYATGAVAIALNPWDFRFPAIAKWLCDRCAEDVLECLKIPGVPVYEGVKRRPERFATAMLRQALWGRLTESSARAYLEGEDLDLALRLIERAVLETSHVR